MNKTELKELITPEFLSTLRVILKHIHWYEHKLDMDWDEIDYLPGCLEDFVTGNYYD